MFSAPFTTELYISRWAIRLGMADNIDTQTELAKIQEIYNSVVNGAENMVYMTLRFYIFNKDLSALKKRVAVVQKELATNNGLRSYVPENQMFTEFTRLIVEGNNIQTPMPIYDTYAKEFPFYYQEHIDDNGLFMVYTQTNGLVFLDSFLRNRYRPLLHKVSYHMTSGICYAETSQERQVRLSACSP